MSKSDFSKLWTFYEHMNQISLVQTNAFRRRSHLADPAVNKMWKIPVTSIVVTVVNFPKLSVGICMSMNYRNNRIMNTDPDSSKVMLHISYRLPMLRLKCRLLISDPNFPREPVVQKPVSWTPGLTNANLKSNFLQWAYKIQYVLRNSFYIG